jgi:hypothetical protein
LFIPAGIFVGGVSPTTNKSIVLPLSSCFAAVAVERVAGGVAPSTKSGSDTTNVDAQQQSPNCCCRCRSAAVTHRVVVLVFGANPAVKRDSMMMDRRMVEL